jgi:hypothetical protein
MFEHTNSQVQGGTGEKVVQLQPEITFFPLKVNALYWLIWSFR